jgi:hypothetical protein
VTLAPLRGFRLAAAGSAISATVIALGGNWLYARDPGFPATRAALVLGVLLVASIFLFSYAMVPLLVRLVLQAQARLVPGARPLIQRLRQRERVIWYLGWGVCTLGLLLALGALLRNWGVW